MRISRPVHNREVACFAGIFSLLHTYSTAVERSSSVRHTVAFSTAFHQKGDVDNGRRRTVRLYSPAAGRTRAEFFLSNHETDLSAERTQAEPQARFPQPHVHPRGPLDPEAPPREGPQAPLGVTGAAPEPSLTLSRFRCRLPARPVGVDAVSDPLLVPARRATRCSAPRLRGSEGGRQRGRPESHQAPAS